MLLEREEMVGGALENASESKSERKARNVPVVIDGVDALARDTDLSGELLLRPSVLGAHLSNAIAYRGCHVGQACPSIYERRAGMSSELYIDADAENHQSEALCNPPRR